MGFALVVGGLCRFPEGNGWWVGGVLQRLNPNRAAESREQHGVFKQMSRGALNA